MDDLGRLYMKLADKNVEGLLSDTPDGVIYMRPDINVHVNPETGKISMVNPNLRLEYTAYAIDLYSERPIVITAHQGDVGDSDFIGFTDHVSVLNTLTRKTKVYYERLSNSDPYFDKRLMGIIKGLNPREALVLDNIRNFSFEKGFKKDEKLCSYMNKYFRDCGVTACINEAGPALHRDHWSMSCQPDIAPTYVGVLTAKEVKLVQNIKDGEGRKIIVVGGAKPKISDVEGMASYMDIGLVGLTAQYFLRINGYDLGEDNNRFVDARIKGTFDEKEIEKIRQLANKYKIMTPSSFKVMVNDDVKEVTAGDLRHTKGIIVDIGDGAVDDFAKRIKGGGYDWNIFAGAAGIFEKKQNNGAELVYRTLGPGTVVLGGDTIESLQQAGLLEPIEGLGGTLCTMGGSALHRWAGKPWYSLDRIGEKQVR